MLKETIKMLRPAAVVFVLLTMLTGLLYPLLITLAASVLAPNQAALQTVNGQVVGSSLVGQNFTAEKYFWPRPSAVGYNPLPSGGSNLGPISLTLQQTVAERAMAIRTANKLAADATIPVDLLFASGSGLDPHISPEGAALQAARVAAARGISEADIKALIGEFTERPQFGILGQPRVNVLLLNIALDARYPAP
jgi:potassium-transporting ATPase KdpC subunit